MTDNLEIQNTGATQKYLFIDSNNLGVRNAFANATMKTSQGVSSGVHFGMMSSLLSLKKIFPGYKMLMSWDGSSKRRKTESELGVINKIIPSTYKSNRIKEDLPQPLKDFYEQMLYLKRVIGKIGIPQIHISEYESDDILASYSRLLKNNPEVEIVMVTSDHDYYQLLDHNVKIWDGMKQVMITEQSFRDEYGIDPEKWVDVGALCGDTGDNILSIHGWGDKTAIKEVINYGSCFNVVKKYNELYQKERLTYPDLCNNDNQENRDKFDKLANVLNKKGAKVYPDVNWESPFTGVAYEYEFNGLKISKSVLSCLVYQKRVDLAYSLKKMDNINVLPDIEWGTYDEKSIQEYLDYYELNSFKKSNFKFF